VPGQFLDHHRQPRRDHWPVLFAAGQLDARIDCNDHCEVSCEKPSRTTPAGVSLLWSLPLVLLIDRLRDLHQFSTHPGIATVSRRLHSYHHRPGQRQRTRPLCRYLVERSGERRRGLDESLEGVPARRVKCGLDPRTDDGPCGIVVGTAMTLSRHRKAFLIWLAVMVRLSWR
jgi:hypothetical protein